MLSVCYVSLVGLNQIGISSGIRKRLVLATASFATASFATASFATARNSPGELGYELSPEARTPAGWCPLIKSIHPCRSLGLLGSLR